MFGANKNQKPLPEQQLKDLRAKCADLEQSLASLRKELDQLKQTSLAFVQKLAVARYNPFDEQGGDQSFSIALLDANDNGFVLSSLYGHHESRAYIKPIKQGQSSHNLSDEESAVLKQALQQ